MATADYNSATITVATRTLRLASERVLNLVVDVAHRLEAIMHTLDHLSLSWVGSSASEAKDFGDRWSATMVELFGKPTDGPYIAEWTGKNAKARTADAAVAVAPLIRSYLVPLEDYLRMTDSAVHEADRLLAPSPYRGSGSLSGSPDRHSLDEVNQTFKVKVAEAADLTRDDSEAIRNRVFKVLRAESNVPELVAAVRAGKRVRAAGRADGDPIGAEQTFNVDHRGEPNQFGVVGPELRQLRQHAVPGSLVTYRYDDTALSDGPADARFGRHGEVRSVNELRDRPEYLGQHALSVGELLDQRPGVLDDLRRPDLASNLDGRHVLRRHMRPKGGHPPGATPGTRLPGCGPFMLAGRGRGTGQREATRRGTIRPETTGRRQVGNVIAARDPPWSSQHRIPYLLDCDVMAGLT